MNKDKKEIGVEYQEQLCAVAMGRRVFSIGLPRNAEAAEKRFPLTPEGVGLLVEQGFTVRIEQEAGSTIHYTDAAYARVGALVCGRDEALSADIVVSLPVPEPADIRRMRRGAMLLTLFRTGRFDRMTVKELLSRNIVTIGLDLITDKRGNAPFADLLAEIDGRAAVSRASSLLADSKHGKGILLGGIAGVVACEVAVIGSGISACAAARSAIGLGAMVRMLDNDVYRLREAQREVGCGAVVSSLHPRALETALRTADVIVYTDVEPGIVIDSGQIELAKRGVIIFDLSADAGKAFPSLPTVDLSRSRPVDLSPTSASRVCYVNAGGLVPRTAAMGLSDALLAMFGEILTCEGLTNALKLIPGMQRAALTFLGKPVNADIAMVAGMRHVDINIYLTLS